MPSYIDSAIQTSPADMDTVLLDMQKVSGSLGEFLQEIFRHPSRGDKDKGLVRSQRHSQMVAKFLQGRSKVKAEEIVDIIYNHPEAVPKTARSNALRPASVVLRPDKEPMARWRIREWAVSLVAKIVSKEAEVMASKDGGLHLSKEQVNWQFVHQFSFGKVMATVEDKAPTLLRVLTAAAISPKKPADTSVTETPEWASYVEHFSKPVPSGSGNNKRDPFVIVSIACMMLFAARNIQFVVFQQIIGLFLFANACSYAIYPVLNRAGISTSYTTIGKLLHRLSWSTQEEAHAIAKTQAFLPIYDNINRMRRVWDPELGQKDTVLNGTVATLVEIEDCNVEKALDPQVLKESIAKGGRANLNIDVLYSRVDFYKLHSIFALHSLKFLADEVEALAVHQQFINIRFRTTLQGHRMRPGRQSNIVPLQTSDINEGTTGGQKDVINDLNLRQLKLSEEELTKLMLILGGDQSTVEKLRTLKRFLHDCTHGYSQYGWVLPLIQLWHMGWADLERVLSTHWGPDSGDADGDISTFRAVNILLGRKVKDMKRPDYYPTQHLIFDNLKLEILDCWKVHLGTDTLEAYFCEHPTEIEDLLKLADEIVRQYLTTEASERARSSNNLGGGKTFVQGTRWNSLNVDAQVTSASTGDQVLANTILRMRDSMTHYEFHHALADGDIGRALNVMALWTFTFTGSGRGKYSNELLELACNFEYEYSQELQELILNNWLVNLSGIEGCWFPMDLMEEHNIKQLKKLAERRDATFSGEFFKDVIAMNIRALLKANESIREAVRLGHQGGSHRRKKKVDAEKRLADIMAQRELHKYRSGRHLGHEAQDDFDNGYNMLDDGKKIRGFVTRTMLDAGAIYEDNSADQTTERSGRMLPSMPNMLVNGMLVTGEVDDEDDEAGDGSDEGSNIGDD